MKKLLFGSGSGSVKPFNESVKIIFFLILIYFNVQLSSSCYFTNCPWGGKRSSSQISELKSIRHVRDNIRIKHKELFFFLINVLFLLLSVINVLRAWVHVLVQLYVVVRKLAALWIIN